jgi:hypothetical protein
MVGDECTRPLLPDVRERLSKFMVDTARYSDPATDVEIDNEISLLMLGYSRARTISSAEADATVIAYTDILRGQPFWAITAGFRKVKLNQVDGLNPDFPPSASRLLKIVTNEMVPLRADRIEVGRLLAARDALPEDPVMAQRAAEAQKLGLNPMQVKYGKDYGIDSKPAANGFGVLKPLPEHKQTRGPTIASVVARYSASPGRITWLANRLAVMRGEVADTPEVPLCGAEEVAEAIGDRGGAKAARL